MFQKPYVSNIFRPMALITPAKSHSEVIIAAVAARDKQKAEAYAKKHDIPIVHNSYQGISDCCFFPPKFELSSSLLVPH
jgi:hypothetical protein